MDLNDMSLEQLRTECEDRGLKSYGTKPQMIERIQESDANELADQSQVPALDEFGEVRVIAPTEADMARYGAIPNNNTHAPVNSREEVKAIYEALVARFKGSGVVIEHDLSYDTFSFTGGRQGKITTTAQQPKSAIEGVARNYFNMMHSAVRNDGGLGE